MPIIQIPFDLPFDYCKNCAALDPKAKRLCMNNKIWPTFFCENAPICTLANRAQEIAKQEATP